MSRIARLTVFFLLVSTGLAVPMTASPPADAQQTLTAPSPDEVAVPLKQYLAQNATLPTGWAPRSVVVLTDAALAYKPGDPAGSAQALSSIQAAGFVESFRQAISPTNQLHAQQGQKLVLYQVSVYGAPAPAQAALSNPTDGSTLSGTTLSGMPSFGDGPQVVALKTASLPAAALPLGLTAPTDDYRLRWTRGPLLFDLQDYVVGGMGDSSTVTAFASTLDARAAGLGTFSAGPPQFSPPASEADRLAALERMETVVTDPSAIPSGFQAGPLIIQSVASDVFAATGDPAVALSVDETQLQRIISEIRVYGTPGTNAQFVGFVITEDLTSDAAEADLHFPGTNVPTDAISQMRQPPLQLGDDTVLWDTVFGPSSSGSTEEWDLSWRHGNVILTAAVGGPPSTLSQTTLQNTAGWLEDAYQQSAYVTPTAGTSAPGDVTH